MALITDDIFGQRTDKVKRSIERIRAFEPPEGYFLGFSGGKDSIVIKALADMAGVRYDAHYSVTTVDPPELTRYIREKHPDVIFDRPRLSMRQLIIEHQFPPTRFMRYCCKELKEVKGDSRVVMTGTRWAESVKRRDNQGIVTVFNGKNGKTIAEAAGAEYKPTQRGGIILNMDNDPARRVVEQCYRTNRTLVNPIIDWSDSDIWEFIKVEGIPYCSLYDDGWKRLGCIGCPLGGVDQQKRQFIRWPYMCRVYLHAFADMLEARKAEGKTDTKWKDADEVMKWWLTDSRKYIIPVEGQMEIVDILPGGGE